MQKKSRARSPERASRPSGREGFVADSVTAVSGRQEIGYGRQ